MDLKNLLKFQASSLTVVEFNGTTVRVCRSVPRKSERQVTHCFSFESQNFDKDAVHQLNRQIKKNRVRMDQVVLALPRHCAMSRLVKFPSKIDEEIRNMVALYVSREKAYNRDQQILHDYKVVGQDDQGNSLVSIFFIQKERLNRYLAILEKCRIFPQRVTINTQGLLTWSHAQSLPDLENPHKCFFLLNADLRTFDFNVICRGHVIFSRTFTQPSHVEDIGKWLAGEVNVAFELFRRGGAEAFEYEMVLYVTGNYENLEQELSSGSKPWQIKTLDPMDNFMIHDRLKESLKTDSVSYASVLGLASAKAEGIDVTPLEVRQKAFARVVSRDLHRFGILFLAVLFLGLLVTGRAVDLEFREVEGLRQKMQALMPIEKDAKLLTKWSLLRKDAVVVVSPGDILMELYRRAPESVHVSSLSMDKTGQVSVQGFGSSLEQVLAFVKSLEESGMFGDVRLGSVDAKMPRAEGSDTHFRMILIVKGQEGHDRSKTATID